MAKLPNKILVGVVDREDTYTGKLGYVTYPKSTKEPETPHHGIWGWMERNKSKHPLLKFDNVPTEGFVINKKVGGKKPYYSEYKGRTVKARVYDPRGFEFEIDMENMCHILENNGSFPGKALDGEFVYAWMGSGSVFLLSCKSKEYKDLTLAKEPFSIIKEFKTMTKYKRSNGMEVLYLGKTNVNKRRSMGFDNGKKNCHVFYSFETNHICYPKDIIEELPHDNDVINFSMDFIKGWHNGYNYLSNYNPISVIKTGIDFSDVLEIVKRSKDSLRYGNVYYIIKANDIFKKHKRFLIDCGNGIHQEFSVSEQKIGNGWNKRHYLDQGFSEELINKIDSGKKFMCHLAYTSKIKYIENTNTIDLVNEHDRLDYDIEKGEIILFENLEK